MFCPRRKGFFPYLTTKIKESLSLEESINFATLDNYEDRIKFVLSLPRLTSSYEDNLFKIIKPLYGDKSQEKSEENREAGNAAFQSGNYKQAQILYSIAVFTAPAESESNCFPLALANRSACLQRLGSHKLAISDIDLALESGYPKSKLFKLLERKGECLEQIGNLKEASLMYQKAASSLDGESIPKDKRNKIKQELSRKLAKVSEEMTRIIDSKDICKLSVSVGSQESDEICDIVSPNPLYPSAHSSIEIRYDQHFGRYAVAASDIALGTTLIHERPVTYSLYPEKFGLNCQHCFKVIRAVIPCPKCSWVCFCSRECRDIAVDSYHKYECPIIKLLIESGLNVYSFLALRAVCKEGLESLNEFKDIIENERDETAGETARQEKMYRSNDFINLINLSAQEDKLESEDWFLRTFVACFLLKLIMVTDFFKESKSETIKEVGITKDQMYVAKIFLLLLNILPCNCHDISEIESPVPDQFAPTCNKVSLGAGVYLTLAMFNHACKPDFMRCNKGNGVVCIANRHIKRGEEICENYGLMYTMKSLKERKKILKDHYKFDCCCQACSENWPTLNEMKAQVMQDPEDKRMGRFIRFKCVHCQSNLPTSGGSISGIVRTCLVCGKETNIMQDIPLRRIKETCRYAVQYLLTGQWSRGIELATECHDLVMTHVGLPVLELTDVQIAIWKCMWLKIGNIKLVKMV